MSIFCWSNTLPFFRKTWIRTFWIVLVCVHLYVYIYICVYIEYNGLTSSSSCHAISTDIPDPLPPLFSIIHHFWYVFKATSCISTELLYVGSSWSSWLCSSMWGGPQEYVTYEFNSTSPAVSHMSGSSNLDSFRDGW